MSQTPFQGFPSRNIARRDAVKIIAGASAAIALSPSMALADNIEEGAQADQTLMNSWRYDQGEPHRRRGNRRGRHLNLRKRQPLREGC